MSGFKKAEEALVISTQSYFSESAIYKRGVTEQDIQAVFRQEWIEDSGVSTYSMTSRLRDTELGEILVSPALNDQIIYNEKTYTVSVAQKDDAGVWMLVLRE